MNDNVLKRILNDYPNIWKESNRFKALLMDLIFEDKLKRNLILISADENIPEKILKLNHITSRELYYLRKELIKACGCNNQIAEDIIYLWADALDVTIEPASIISIAKFNKTEKQIKWSSDETDEYLKTAFKGDPIAVADCQSLFIDDLEWEKEDDWSDISLCDFMPSKFSSCLEVVTMEEYRGLQLDKLVDKARTNAFTYLRAYMLMIPAFMLVRKFVMNYEPTSEESLYIAINVWNLETELGEKGYHRKRGDGLEDLFYWLNDLYSDFTLGRIEIEDVTEVEYKLGLCYAFGIGVDANIKKCEEIWRTALMRPRSHYNVYILRICRWLYEGIIHIKHNSAIYIEKDYELAFCSFREMMDVYSEACYYLAKFYENGYYVKRNMEQAIELYQKASDKGNKYAQMWIDDYENSEKPHRNHDNEVVAIEPEIETLDESKTHGLSLKENTSSRRINTRNMSYPENLITEIGLCRVFGENKYIELTSDQVAGLDYALGLLKPKERIMILKRYSEHQTYKQIGDSFDCSVENARQVVVGGIRKLHTSSMKRYFVEGLDVVKKKESKIRESSIKVGMSDDEIRSLMGEFADIKIEWFLSRHSCRCLDGTFIRTLYDLVCKIYRGPEQMARINRLGKKSLEEIINKVKEYNIEIPHSYDYFFMKEINENEENKISRCYRNKQEDRFSDISDTVINQNKPHKKVNNLNMPYPENIITEIGLSLVFGKDEYFELTVDQVMGLEYALKLLDHKEEDVIRKRFIEHETYKQIGVSINYSESFAQVLVTRAINKLRHPPIARYYIEGLRTIQEKGNNISETSKIFTGMSIENIIDILGKDADVEIADLGLSLHSYKCLRREGIDRISELINIIINYPEQTEKIRGLGKQWLREVLSRIKRYDVEIPHYYDYVFDD